MAARTQVRLCFPFVAVLCITGLTYQSANSANQTGGATQSPSAQSEGHAPPIPRVSPLADPKSLKQVGLPVGATRAAVPADNPQTPEKVALGQKLFFDGRLSADGSVACSTSHDPAHAFTAGREVSMGIKGRLGQRNAPTVLNARYNVAQFWDGRSKTLEDQAALPIQNSSEMGQPTLEAAVKQIAAVNR